jgi:hypothetical protein
MTISRRQTQMAKNRRYRIDIEPAGKKWTWTVWAWGPDHINGDAEAWRPPWVSIEDIKPGLEHIGDYRGRAKSLFTAELAARQYIAWCETTLSEVQRHREETVTLEIEV